VKFGVALGALNPRLHVEAVIEAERLGFESIWLPEHLVLTRTMSSSPYPGADHPPIPADTPVYDAFVYLAFLAAKTERVRLGTHVYNIGLRHPFTTARGVQTVDVLSNGRFEFGIGASWLAQEWDATALDFTTRGRRVDEALTVCKRLWSEPTVTHHGEFFSFDGVAFEPKPVQKPWPPVLVGGESTAALRRAARSGDGWLGMGHTLDTAAPRIEELHRLLAEHDRDADAFQVVVGGSVDSTADVERWERLGVTRLIVSPWRRSKEAISGLQNFAARAF
jgi:probable F420-dependent oxidoreductase